MGVDGKNERVLVPRARRRLGIRIVPVALQLKTARIPVRGRGVRRDLEVARHWTHARAGDLHRIDAPLLAGEFLAPDRHGHRHETRLLLRPERVEVRRLRHTLQFLGLDPRTAVEENRPVVAPAIGLAVRVRDFRVNADKSRFFEGSRENKRLGGGNRPQPFFDLSVVARARPLDEKGRIRNLFRADRLEFERHLLAGGVKRLVLEGAPLQEHAVPLAGERGESHAKRRERGHPQLFHMLNHPFTFVSCIPIMPYPPTEGIPKTNCPRASARLSSRRPYPRKASGDGRRMPCDSHSSSDTPRNNSCG